VLNSVDFELLSAPVPQGVYISSNYRESILLKVPEQDISLSMELTPFGRRHESYGLLMGIFMDYPESGEFDEYTLSL
jgi:hypothetical protein